VKGFPAEHKVKVFRVVLSTKRTDYVVTNEMAQDNVEVVQDVCGFRWKVEQFHRETNQLTSIEGNQCRKARSVRNRIGCAILVWVRLKQVAVETRQTIYRESKIFWTTICANNASRLLSRCALLKS
jgi:hypothetical protein